MLNEKGQEIPDQTPIVIRVRHRVITEFDRVREFIRNNASAIAQEAGRETFEESNDFEVDDDLFPVSPHEYDADTEAADRETLHQHHQKKAPPPAPPPPSPPQDSGVQTPQKTVGST